MARKILAVNLKAYPSAFSVDTVRDLAREAKALESRYGIDVVLLPPAPLLLVARAVHERVYAQHVDPPGLGQATGRLPVDALPLMDIKGFMVNHSEAKVSSRHLASVLEYALMEGLEAIVCADTPREAAAAASMGARIVAVEPPELIGSGVSVSKARPEVITESVRAVASVNRSVILLAGAGISGKEDVEAALRLGAGGVLVASYVAKSRDPPTRLRELAEGMARV